MSNQKVVITGGRLAGRATLTKILQEMDFSVVEGHALKHNQHPDIPEPPESHEHPLGKPRKAKRRRLKRKPGGKL